MAPSLAVLVSVFAALLSSPFPSEAQLPPSPSPSVPISYISFSPDGSPSSSPPAPAPAPGPALSSSFSPEPKTRAIQLVESNLRLAKRKVKEFREELLRRSNDLNETSYVRDCARECHEVYGAAVDGINDSIYDVAGGDLYKAKVDITAISDNVDTCEQCFEEMVGEDPDIKAFDDWVRGVTDDCLDALDRFSS